MNVVFGVSAFLVLGLVIACMLICVYAKSTLRSKNDKFDV